MCIGFSYKSGVYLKVGVERADRIIVLRLVGIRGWCFGYVFGAGGL